MKAIYDKSTAIIILNGEKLKAFLLKSGTKQGCPLSPFLFNMVLEAHSNQTNKRNKRYPNWKRKKNSLYANDVILYIENPKDSRWKLLKLVNKLSNIAGKKINIQTLVAFLYTNNEILEKWIKKVIPFKIAPLKIKYLVRNLTKEVKDLYAGNYKILIKEM